MSVAAFDSALRLARNGRYLMSEGLLVRERVLAGKIAGGGSGGHWDEYTGEQRLAELWSCGAVELCYWWIDRHLCYRPPLPP